MSTRFVGVSDLHRALSEASRVHILEALQSAKQPGLDARELGRAVGLHPNTVRSHLELLIQAGLVRARSLPSPRPGRPRMAYELVDRGALASAANPGYKLLAQILASYLASSAADPAAAAEKSGRLWGRYLADKPEPFAQLSAEAAIQKIVDLFEGLGFMPEARAEGGEKRILLHHCPFREAAVANPTVVCGVHLGLLRGALREMGAPLEATRLDPMVGPLLCIAHLGPRVSRAPSSPGRIRSQGRPAAPSTS